MILGTGLGPAPPAGRRGSSAVSTPPAAVGSGAGLGTRRALRAFRPPPVLRLERRALAAASPAPKCGGPAPAPTHPVRQGSPACHWLLGRELPFDVATSGLRGPVPFPSISARVPPLVSEAQCLRPWPPSLPGEKVRWAGFDCRSRPTSAEEVFSVSERREQGALFVILPFSHDLARTPRQEGRKSSSGVGVGFQFVSVLWLRNCAFEEKDRICGLVLNGRCHAKVPLLLSLRGDRGKMKR